MGSDKFRCFKSLFITTILVILQVCVAIYPAYDQSYDEYSSYPSSYPEGEDYNPYHGREVLDSKGRYILEWTADYKTKMITFNITCNSTGWVGLGMSKDGKMKEADIMIGGVRSNGQPYLSDMHADYYRKLYSDTKQDWILVSAWEKYGVTYLKVARPFDSCDPYDYPITMDLLSVIWAFGETDDIEYHFEKRGSFKVYLLDPIIRTYEKPLEVWKIRSSVVLTHNKPTTYICVIRKAPVLTEKHHMVEVHPYFENEVAVAHTHHIALWRCVPPTRVGADVFFGAASLHPGEECYFTRVHVLPHLLCKMLIIAWAIGGKPFILPYSIGFPLGETPDEYYMLETHYDNHLGYSGVSFTTGLDIYYTKKLRPNDAGALFIASNDMLGLFMIPPVSTDFEVYGYCTPKCTKTMFPDGIEIVAVLLHAHISGRQVKFQQFRGGYELEVILKDDNYDSTFQQNRVLYEERLVLPGDQLVATCNYDNTWSNITTVSGFSTREEMCVAIAIVKKRVPYFMCCSQVPQETLLPLIGVDHVEWDIEKQERVITEPPSLAGKPLSYVTDGLIDWDKQLRYRIQEVTVRSVQTGSCPRVLAPAGCCGAETNADSPEGLLGTILSSEASEADILTLAKAYGTDTLMGTIGLPTRTPGPVSFASYPFSGARYLGRTCPRMISPFAAYFSPPQGGMTPAPPYSYQTQPQPQYANSKY